MKLKEICDHLYLHNIKASVDIERPLGSAVQQNQGKIAINNCLNVVQQQSPSWISKFTTKYSVGPQNSMPFKFEYFFREVMFNELVTNLRDVMINKKVN